MAGLRKIGWVRAGRFGQNLRCKSLGIVLRAGTPQIGVWVGLSSPFAAEIIAGAGFDWAMVDMEHSPNDLTSVLGQLQAFAGYDTTAMVRPEWNDPVLVKRLLDIGAPGLLFPMVQSVAEAQKAVASTRYPPPPLAPVRAAAGRAPPDQPRHPPGRELTAVCAALRHVDHPAARNVVRRRAGDVHAIERDCASMRRQQT